MKEFQCSSPLFSSYVNFFLCICISQNSFPSPFLFMAFFFHYCRLIFYILNFLEHHAMVFATMTHFLSTCNNVTCFSSPCLLQWSSPCIFLCYYASSLFDFFFISFICFFACRSCFSPSLFCGRLHDDLILLHLCWHWANFSNFSYVLSFHVWLPSTLPLYCTLVNFFQKTNWNFKVFV